MASLQLHNLVRPHDIVSGQLDPAPGENEVMPPPDVAGGHLDPPERCRMEKGIPRYQFSAPVSAPGSAIAVGIAIGKVGGKPLSSNDFARVRRADRLRQRRQLEERHVPREQALSAGPQRLDERRRVRRRQDCQRDDPICMPASRPPGLAAAQVMTNKWAWARPAVSSRATTSAAVAAVR